MVKYIDEFFQKILGNPKLKPFFDFCSNIYKRVLPFFLWIKLQIVTMCCFIKKKLEIIAAHPRIAPILLKWNSFRKKYFFWLKLPYYFSLKDQPKEEKRKRIIKISIFLSVSFVVFLATFIVSLVLIIQLGGFGGIPTNEQIAKISNQEASLVYSSDKQLIGKYFSENRYVVDIKDIPQHVIDALISTEDIRFMQHEGIDFQSLLRVFVKSILFRQESAGGGSTISQQLIKNVYGRKNYSILTMPVAKVKEMIIASKLEEVYTKNEILALYLNTVSFGENVYGIESASFRYFSKTCRDLKIEEGAVLVGMLKANTYYNPHLYPQNAFERRNTVLSQMRKNEILNQRELDSLSKIELKIKYQSASDLDKENGYFLAYVKDEVTKIIAKYNQKHQTEYDLLTDGLTIETTLNKRIQNAYLEANRKHLLYLQKIINEQFKSYKFWDKKANAILLNGVSTSKDKKATLLPWGLDDTILNMSSIDSLKYLLTALQSAVLASDPNTGAVLAWIGGSNFQFFPYNRVLAQRQVGSTFKPLVYYTALEHGISPCEYYSNELVTYSEYENWSPGNSDGKYDGYYSMQGALANSVNTVSAKILFDAGIDNCITTARNLGIKSQLPEYPSLVLGVANTSLYEMVQAYCAFANNGYAVDLYTIQKITAKDGTVLYESKYHKKEKVLDDLATNQLIQMMESVVNNGTAVRIRSAYGLQNDIAGKTGTTQNNTDGWFIGFTPNIVVGVWTGFDNPLVRFQNTYTGQGSNTALPIWAQGFKKIIHSKWGKKYGGTFPIDSLNLIDCPMWISDEESEQLENNGDNFIKSYFKRLRIKNDTIPDSLQMDILINDTVAKDSTYREKRRAWRIKKRKVKEEEESDADNTESSDEDVSE